MWPSSTRTASCTIEKPSRRRSCQVRKTITSNYANRCSNVLFVCLSTQCRTFFCRQKDLFLSHASPLLPSQCMWSMHQISYWTNVSVFFFHFLFLVVVAPCVRRESTLRPLNRIPTFVIILINMKRLKRVFSKTRLPNSQRRPPSMRLHLQKVSSVQIMIHPIIYRNDYNFSLFCFLLKEKKKKHKGKKHKEFK